MDHQSHEPARFWYYYDFSPLQPGRYYCGDCFQLLPAIESGTVDMVLIDPPYYMGKDKAWDCFEGRADYMAFMGRAFIQAQRILKENGTLGFWHNDLQKITWLCDWLERNTDMRFATWGIWVKPNHRRKIWVNPGPGNTLRSWFNIGEFCVFFVKGTAGTAWNKTGLELAKLNTENFGSLRDYFRRLLEYTGATKRQIIETVGQSADHCFRFGSTQWLLPTRETYLKIVAAFHCDSWEGYRTFESLEAERNNAMASYADQIQEANAARFVHNLDSKPWISKRNASQRHTFVHSQRGTGFCFSLDGNHFESVGHAEEKAKRDCVNGGLTNGTTCYFEQCGGVDRRTAGSCCHALRDRSGGEDRRQ